MLNHPVLVLNQSYEPLTVCRARRAVVLIYQGKAEMIENGMGSIHSLNATFELPSVIRVCQHVKRPYRQRKMTRYEIFNRDKYTCQYCSQQSRHLTLDHVIPRYRGGQHTWENVVSACVECNRRKAGRTPKEANMKLIKTPGPPSGNHLFNIPYHYLSQRDEWRKYLYQ
ncbi:MAG: HNH endonuclease [Dehalococcoidales bacterium]|jgi:5-methylcytosine-specific restriction endonuclease McrA